MRIKSVSIRNIGIIKDLTLSFNDQMNLLCGPNGVGKSTILDVIASFFAEKGSKLKRNVNENTGSVTLNIENGGSLESDRFDVTSFLPTDEAWGNSFWRHKRDLFNMKSNRSFSYITVESVFRDANIQGTTLLNAAIDGIQFTTAKNWFLHRFTYAPHSGALTPEQIFNFELAKSFFSLLNRDYSYSRVRLDTNDIMVNTPGGEIFLEYLSSGFKSFLTILLGVIKEIEYRYTNPGIRASDFNGVVLIDEIELHFHPEWQSRIVNVLTRAFPKAQFILSTHSPHVIQTARSNHIIALSLNGGNVVQKEMVNSEYGFQGWTIEEVLSDVMGMKDLRTEFFEVKIKEFGEAIDQENYTNAKEIYEDLDLLLHPNNYLRNLLKFQLAGIKGENI